MGATDTSDVDILIRGLAEKHFPNGGLQNSILEPLRRMDTNGLNNPPHLDPIDNFLQHRRSLNSNIRIASLEMHTKLGWPKDACQCLVVPVIKMKYKQISAYPAYFEPPFGPGILQVARRLVPKTSSSLDSFFFYFLRLRFLHMVKIHVTLHVLHNQTRVQAISERVATTNLSVDSSWRLSMIL